MEEKKYDVEPITEKDLNHFFGDGINCPNAGKEGAYDPDCCWHDCKKSNGKATKFWTAWS